MAWQQVRGHDSLVEVFRRSLQQERLASTFLFVGPPGVGKRLFADQLARTLLCSRRAAERMDPCGECPDCAMVQAGSHPDLEVVAKPADRAVIPVELLIGDIEHRMREGLCHRISLRPFRGGHKIAIIDDADYLNPEGANCLLKTLEEPPPRSVLMLIGTSEQKQLPTIRSRCQVVRFRPLPDEVLAELLLEKGWAEQPEEAEQLAHLGRGSLREALRWREEGLAEFREVLLEQLAQGAWNAPELAKTVAAFVDQAGKESAPRRERLRTLIELSCDFYSRLMRRLSGGNAWGDPLLLRTLDAAQSGWRGTAETACLCVDRCVEALGHVDANANQATLIECWLDDLAEIGWHADRLQAR